MTASRRPTRTTVEGRAYLDLQNLARNQQRPTDELHQLYALEGFLTRLSRSPHADRLVLKGGVLLAAYDARRPTRDVDVQAEAIVGNPDDVLRLICDIAAGAVDDGLVFDTAAATADVIRDDAECSGVTSRTFTSSPNATRPTAPICNAHSLRSPRTDASNCHRWQAGWAVTPPSARPAGQPGGANSI